MRLATAALIGLFCYGLGTTAFPGESGRRFIVLTWNARKCRGTDNITDCNRIADWIARIGADVALLSAIRTSDDARRIKSRLDGGWDVYFAAADCARCNEGQAILSRHPLSNTISHQVSVRSTSEDQVIVKATVSMAGTDINVFAVDHDHRSAAARRDQAIAFTNWANAFPEPRIVGGDFNEPAGDAIEEWLHAQGYHDAWSEAAARGVHTGYTGNSSGRTRRSRLDRILLSRGAVALTIGAARVWDTRDSATTCRQVTALLCNPAKSECGNGCDSNYVDDRGVRPSDHAPVTVKVTMAVVR